MTIDVNASVDKVWARIGKYCDIGEWGIPGCTILSGNGDVGTVRSIGNEILVGKTQYSYTPTRSQYVSARFITCTTVRLRQFRSQRQPHASDIRFSLT